MMIMSAVFVFNLVQLPPGDPGPEVVFIEIPEKITGDHGPEVIPFLGPGPVFAHGFGMGFAVGDKGSKIKQLESPEQCRDDPSSLELGARHRSAR